MIEKRVKFKKGYFGTLKAVSFIFPQEPESNEIMDYAVTINYIEQLTGLEFFPEMTARKQKNFWRAKNENLAWRVCHNLNRIILI